MNFSRNKIFNSKVCRIKPFISGFGSNPIEYRAKTGRLHCLLHSFSCDPQTRKIIHFYDFYMFFFPFCFTSFLSLFLLFFWHFLAQSLFLKVSLNCARKFTFRRSDVVGYLNLIIFCPFFIRYGAKFLAWVPENLQNKTFFGRHMKEKLTLS